MLPVSRSVCSGPSPRARDDTCMYRWRLPLTRIISSCSSSERIHPQPDVIMPKSFWGGGACFVYVGYIHSPPREIPLRMRWLHMEYNAAAMSEHKSALVSDGGESGCAWSTQRAQAFMVTLSPTRRCRSTHLSKKTQKKDFGNGSALRTTLLLSCAVCIAYDKYTRDEGRKAGARGVLNALSPPSLSQKATR